jgi:hypothetical protein
MLQVNHPLDPKLQAIHPLGSNVQSIPSLGSNVQGIHSIFGPKCYKSGHLSIRLLWSEIWWSCDQSSFFHYFFLTTYLCTQSSTSQALINCKSSFPLFFLTIYLCSQSSQGSMSQALINCKSSALRALSQTWIHHEMPCPFFFWKHGFPELLTWLTTYFQHTCTPWANHQNISIFLATY